MKQAKSKKRYAFSPIIKKADLSPKSKDNITLDNETQKVSI